MPGDYRVTVEDREYRVRVKRRGERGFLAVLGNGGERNVALPADSKYDEPFTIQVNGRSHTIEIKQRGPTQLTVKVDDYPPSTVRVEDWTLSSLRATKPVLPTASAPRATAVAERRGVVVAPMPGRVVAVRVKAGDSVKPGDTLLILEAMKMENEISASSEGTVKEVKVTAGATVSKGDAMVILQ